MVSEARRAYEAGEWCGECRFGVVEYPPCCEQSNEAIDAAYNAVTGTDDEGWGPERSLEALRGLYAAGVAEGIRQAREAVARVADWSGSDVIGAIESLEDNL